MAKFIHDGQELNYELHGDAAASAHTPVLMLHGNGEDMRIFGAVLALLPPQRCVILLDSRLHGGSRPLPGASLELHYDQMAGDGIALMEHLGIRSYDIVGFSDGGIIALLMAMRSIAVRRIITIGANTDPSGLTRRARAEMRRAAKQAKAEGDVRTAELQRLMLEEPHITRADLAGILADATIVLGRKDPFIDRKHSEAIADAIPHGSHLYVEGAEHGIPHSHPKALADIMNAVL
ncbi:MAG: alpha/beta fold hydrolase [Clostridia bacterium]|nr:alpha/beta fold hydrolase [Clostridia bacterium]